jgi:hypothetical protein
MTHETDKTLHAEPRFPRGDAGYVVSMTTSNTHSNDQVLGAGAEGANTTEKDPGAWVTGDEPMTGAQRSYLDTLARDAGETLTADLSKAQASEEIERLQDVTGRGAAQRS